VTQIALYVMFVSQVLYKAMFLFSPAWNMHQIMMHCGWGLCAEYE
jgi:hypothetical protein